MTKSETKETLMTGTDAARLVPYIVAMELLSVTKSETTVTPMTGTDEAQLVP